MMTINDIRNKFGELYKENKFVVDKSGVKCLEIINANFIADDDVIFGNLNLDWSKREVEWYNTMSLNVNDIPGKIPAIWKQVATKDGFINSNYGWCIFSKNNYEQYDSCLEQLKNDKFSRRATMIYIRPDMQLDYNKDGMSDFMCTYAVQALIRDNKLHLHILMRSNDVVHGFKGDYYWQKYVYNKLYNDLKIIYPELEIGNIYWNAISLHIYERHFYLVEHYLKTGEINITKEKYDEIYSKISKN